MNLLGIRNLTRDKSGISATNEVSNAKISGFINIAQDKLATIIVNINEDFFEEQKSLFNLALNSALYSTPTDMLKFKQLRLAYTDPSSQKDYKIASGYDPTEIDDVSSQEESISTTNPIVDITNNYMRIKPTPTVAVTDGGQIYYISRPSAMATTGAVSVIPVEYHDIMATYAAKEITKAKRMWDIYRVLKGEYKEEVKLMSNQLGARELDRPLRFKNPLEGRARSNVTELGN